MNRNLLATILIVLAIGIYFTVTTKIFAAAQAVSAVNSQYVSAIESAKNLINVRDQVSDEYKRLSPEDQERLAKMIPNSVDNIRLIIDLNNIAMQHGFSLLNVKAAVASANPANPAGASLNQLAMQNPTDVPPSIAAPVLDTVAVSFSVAAPYLQFISFMQDLEANLRIMDVSSIDMVVHDNGVYDFNVVLRTYWLRQQ